MKTTWKTRTALGLATAGLLTVGWTTTVYAAPTPTPTPSPVATVIADADPDRQPHPHARRGTPRPGHLHRPGCQVRPGRTRS